MRATSFFKRKKELFFSAEQLRQKKCLVPINPKPKTLNPYYSFFPFSYFLALLQNTTSSILKSEREKGFFL